MRRGSTCSAIKVPGQRDSLGVLDGALVHGVVLLPVLHPGILPHRLVHARVHARGGLHNTGGRERQGRDKGRRASVAVWQLQAGAVQWAGWLARTAALVKPLISPGRQPTQLRGS